jgi:alpha-tubulin suppressor-like RCC1 family protein
MESGNVYCWGSNGSGQLGLGMFSSSELPGQPVKF